MSNNLHEIDRPLLAEDKYSNLELDEFMVFCILDTACPYEMVCKAFDELREMGMTIRKEIIKWREDMIEQALRRAGYRFPKQHAKRIKDFGYSMIDLKTSTRQELVDNINGIGMKLASMFLRNTRGKEFAVLDVHTLRWLQKNYNFSDEEFKKMSYESKEAYFKSAAEFLSTTVAELDLKIWNENRVGNRK